MTLGTLLEVVGKDLSLSIEFIKRNYRIRAIAFRAKA
jgi:hypothetical protein